MRLSTVESTSAPMSEPEFVHLGLAIWGQPALAHSPQVHVTFQQITARRIYKYDMRFTSWSTRVNMDPWRYPGCKASTFIPQVASTSVSSRSASWFTREWTSGRAFTSVDPKSKTYKIPFSDHPQDDILYWLCFFFFSLQLLINCILICASPAPIESFGLWLLCQSDSSSWTQTASLASWCRRITFRLLWPFRSRHDT